MPDGYFLNERDRRNILQDLHFMGGRRTPAPQRRRRISGGAISSDTDTEKAAGYGILIKEIDGFQIQYGDHESNVFPGFTKKAVIPLFQDQFPRLAKAYFSQSTGGGSESETSDPSTESSEGSKQLILDGINMATEEKILGGTGKVKEGSGSEGSEGAPAEFDNRPILVRGYRELWIFESESESVSESDQSESGKPTLVFVIRDADYPVGIVYGYTVDAVDGSDFYINGVVKIWGHDPFPEPSDSSEQGQNLLIRNIPGWDSDAGAYCVAIRNLEGEWIAIQLECKLGTSESET